MSNCFDTATGSPQEAAILFAIYLNQTSKARPIELMGLELIYADDVNFITKDQIDSSNI